VLREQRAHRFDIGKLWHIAQHQPLIGEQARRHQRQRRILGAPYGDFSGEWPPAADNDFVHLLPSTDKSFLLLFFKKEQHFFFEKKKQKTFVH
jgi:hypothetical protein